MGLIKSLYSIKPLWAILYKNGCASELALSQTFCEIALIVNDKTKRRVKNIFFNEFYLMH